MGAAAGGTLARTSTAALARAAPFARCRGATLRPTAANAAAVDAATLCLVNRERAARHLHALHANPELAHVAASQVSSMVRRNYFADVRPGGRTPLSLVQATRYAVGALGVAIGQNLAWGTGPYASPEHIVDAWMESPPHRKIMLAREYRDAGVAATPAVPAVVGYGQGGATYAIEFGARIP